MEMYATVRRWPARRWLVTGAAAVLAALALGIPTDLIANPWFGRTVPPPWWSLPVLAVCSLLCGLLAATYVAEATTAPSPRGARSWPGLGPVLAFFAIGCPVCNKLVLMALGTTGALNWFEPLQPLLAVASVSALSWAVHRRLRQERGCDVRRPPARISA